MVYAGSSVAFPAQPALPTGLTNKRILTIGDSITLGSSCDAGGGGYRKFLYDTLIAAGKTGWLFCGDLFEDDTAYGLPSAQCRHGGHGGESLSQYQAHLSTTWANAGSADIVLVHLGTNLTGGTTEAALRTFLTALVALMTRDQVVIVAKIVPNGVTDFTTYNASIDGVVSDYNATYSARNIRFYSVDMFTAVTLADMCGDQTHPTNALGYPKMAPVWAARLEAL